LEPVTSRLSDKMSDKLDANDKAEHERDGFCSLYGEASKVPPRVWGSRGASQHITVPMYTRFASSSFYKQITYLLSRGRDCNKNWYSQLLLKIIGADPFSLLTNIRGVEVKFHAFYLFVCSLFNDIFSVAHTISAEWKDDTWWTGKDVEESVRGII
jgi:hypothetical protein